MKDYYFIGIDVSKKNLDCCLLYNGVVVKQDVIGNHQKSIESYLYTMCTEQGIKSEQLILCTEYTGLYIYPLITTCQSIGYKLWMEDPTQIKYSSGLQRGKNDAVDAKRIALYAFRYIDRMKLYHRPSSSLESLKLLSSELNMLCIDKAKYKGQLSDQKEYMPNNIYKLKSKRLALLIKELDKAIHSIEENIENIITENEQLSHQMKLLLTVEGIGKKTALKVILETQAFTKFTDSRKFCCHAGVAPFSYLSGSSQYSKNRVSQRANKSIKSLLHLAALSALQRKDSELRTYYDRKIAEGKNKMCVLNAIRAKLISRMFAVIRNDNCYSFNYNNQYPNS
ncbi:MAG: IS110 family transposase [Dysgonomonas sp.]|nr:IS110 family transposase [Dysgonomonas sp.]